MNFDSVIGQSEVKKRLISLVQENRVPHAIMLCGPSGVGKLALAIGFAHYLMCENRNDDSCGECRQCYMFETFNHPDVHFAFPIVKKNGEKDTFCDEYIEEWRKRISTSPYFAMNHWLNDIGASNKQATIYEAESGAILRKLSLKSSMAGYKVMIIWQPERMNTTCANKILKILEEPPQQTVFILVCEQPDKLLSTIVSRTQRIDVPRINEKEIAEALITRNHIEEKNAKVIAHTANGSYLKALETIHVDPDTHLFLDMYILLMRLAYKRDLKQIGLWADKIAQLAREKQKLFLDYCQKMTRENFIYNFGMHEMNYQNLEEANFSVNFARFINERNVIGLMNEISAAQRDIEQNTNSKMVFFDFALKIIMLLKQK